MRLHFGNGPKDMQSGQILSDKKRSIPDPRELPPPWLIDKINRREREKRDRQRFPEQQPVVEDIEPPPGWRPPGRGGPEEKKDDVDRGVVIFQM